MGFPLVSIAVATNWRVLCRLTVRLVPLFAGPVIAIEAGGQVVKVPAADPSFAAVAVMLTVPGWFAVAMPFWSNVTTAGGVTPLAAPASVVGVNTKWPAAQV